MLRNNGKIRELKSKVRKLEFQNCHYRDQLHRFKADYYRLRSKYNLRNARLNIIIVLLLVLIIIVSGGVTN